MLYRKFLKYNQNKFIRKPCGHSSVLQKYYGLAIAMLSFLIPSFAAAQAFRKPMRDISEQMNQEYQSLKDTGNINKTIPAAFEKQILFALSYFPELKNTRIKFRLKKGGNGIIATRPSWSSVFRSASKRTYIVMINDSSGKEPPRLPLWRNGTVNGQVGIVGHEFCHILYFNRQSGLGLIGLGIRHISKKYMDGFENRTDSVDIERGLAYQLIDWNLYLRKAFGMRHPELGPDPFTQSPADSSANTKLKERYMSPATIRRIISRHPLYQGISITHLIKDDLLT